MELWLDTTDHEAIEFANERGILHGITTNPLIVSRAKKPLAQVLNELLIFQPCPIAVQVMGNDAAEMVTHAKELFHFSRRFIIKVPATSEGLKAIYQLSQHKIPVMATAIFEPIQAFLAAKAGASYIAPYFSQMDEAVFDRIHACIQKTQAKLLAASLKSPEHVEKCLLLGTPAITINETLFHTCLQTPQQTAAALHRFDEAWKTIAFANH